MKQLNLGSPYIYTGQCSLQALQGFDARRIFIVTGGASMFKNGTIARIREYFSGDGKEIHVHSGIPINPDVKAVQDGVARMRAFAPDMIVAVGGGSPIDAAKAMMLLYEHPEITFDNILQTQLPQTRGSVRFVAIPSTSGTGSEVSRSTVVTFREQQLKVAFRTPYFIPDVAILDPELTMSMPPSLVAETGMDAMTHAVESYLNRNADEFTQALAVGAIEGIFDYLPVSYAEKSAASRERMHSLQCMAGIAFANSGLGMVHGIAHSLGGQYDMGHGLLNAIVLPYVLQFDVENDDRMVQVLDTLARKVGKTDFIGSIIELNRALDIPFSLEEAGISARQFRHDFDRLVTNALKGPTASNPVPIDRTQMENLLRRIFKGGSLPQPGNS